eukprot:2868915-Rhodomonas_salina.3
MVTRYDFGLLLSLPPPRSAHRIVATMQLGTEWSRITSMCGYRTQLADAVCRVLMPCAACMGTGTALWCKDRA